MEAEHYEVSAAAAAALSTARQDGRRIIAVGTTTTRTLESLTVSRRRRRCRRARARRRSSSIPATNSRWCRDLITNFHLPKSSLLMLVSALGGRERVLAAYREAVANRYRFYSYGDAMIIL